MSSAVAVALLVAGGVYLLMQRGLLRVTLGFVLLGHAANLVLLAAGGTSRREPPLLDSPASAQTADPLPQAFILTAIVITFGLTVYLLALSGNGADDDPVVETAGARRREPEPPTTDPDCDPTDDLVGGPPDHPAPTDPAADGGRGDDSQAEGAR